MLRTEHLTRRYGDLTAVDDVSFEVSSGEIVGLLGHNGAGKTTVMKLLTGYLEPSSGSAFVDGVNVQDEPTKARIGIGYLPENTPLYSELSVVDYLWFAATVRGVSKDSRREAVEKAIASTDLNDRAMDGIGTLSRGLQQRVGVAQAILHSPGTLILDEPTTGLDPTQTQHMRELIRDLSKNATVVLSTHIMQEVEAICNRVLIMRDGVVAVDELLANLKEGSRCWLTTDASADVVAAALKGTVGTKNLDGRYLLSPQNSEEKCDIPQIVRKLVAKDISVNSIEPERRDLEALFRAVSAGGSHEN